MAVLQQVQIIANLSQTFGLCVGFPPRLPYIVHVVDYGWESWSVCLIPNHVGQCPQYRQSSAWGQRRKSGCKLQLLGPYFVSILSIITIRCLVQFQMAGPSPHSVSRCAMVSVAPHCRQLSLSVKLMVARRSRVGRMT